MKHLRKIVVDPFCFKQFEGKGISSQIKCTIEEFETKINELYDLAALKEGYAPFCKHLFVKNWTETMLGTMQITKDNEHLLRSCYEARTEKELPVLTRYFPQSLVKPEIAPYFDVILYSKEQIQKENEAMGTKDPNADVEYEWGVVSVKPQAIDRELPMSPITIMRNALGKDQGGSGVALDRGKYLESVEFWKENAIILDKN